MNSTRVPGEEHTVVQAGQAALQALHENADNLIECIEVYVDALDLWLSRHDPVQVDQELGVRIADQHATIMMLLDSVKGDVADGLRELREKRKALLAYTDVFPKRISTMKPTKG